MTKPDVLNAARQRLAGHPHLSREEHELYSPVVVLEAERIHAALSSRIDSFVKLEGAGGIYIVELVHISSYCNI